MTGYQSKRAAALDKLEQWDTQVYQRPWVGLTDKEMGVIYEQHHNQYGECESPNWGYERAIEQALKNKNK
jgi:hypothetical protein